MKNFIFLFLFSLFSMFSFTSCESDEGLDTNDDFIAYGVWQWDSTHYGTPPMVTVAYSGDYDAEYGGNVTRTVEVVESEDGIGTIINTVTVDGVLYSSESAEISSYDVSTQIMSHTINGYVYNTHVDTVNVGGEIILITGGSKYFHRI